MITLIAFLAGAALGILSTLILTCVIANKSYYKGRMDQAFYGKE